MFNHLFKDSLTLKTVTSRDAYDNTTSTPSTIACKLKYKNRVIKSRAGKDVNVMAEITTATALTISDMLTIDGKDWEIIQTQPVKDFNGTILHYKAFI